MQQRFREEKTENGGGKGWTFWLTVNQTRVITANLAEHL